MDTTVSLAIVGGRNFNNYDLLRSEVDAFIALGHNVHEIVSGGAIGADQLGERYAKEHEIKFVVFKPDWNSHGRAAGMIRNGDIIGRCTHVIAFWDGISAGTKNSIDRANRSGKPCKVVMFK